MFKRFFWLFGPALLAVTALSCSFDLFDKVQVKGSPSIYAPLGENAFSLTDYISTDDMTSMFSSGSAGDLDVYRFNDTAQPDVMKFLVHYPVADMELNFGSYLDSIDLSSTALSAPLPAQSFTIPAISSAPQSSPVDFNLNDSILGAISLPSINRQITELGITMSHQPASLSFNLSNIDSATFSSGNLVLNFRMTGASPGFSFVIESTELQDSAGNPISTSATPSFDLSDNLTHPVALPLAGKTLPQAMKIVITVTMNGGDGGSAYITADSSFSADTVISDATGISMNHTISIPAVTVPAASSNFVRATISADAGSGSLVIDVGSAPAAMTGFSRYLDLSLTGGIVLDGSYPVNEADNTVTIDLSGSQLNAGDIQVSGSYHFSASSGAISGMTGDTSTLDISTAVSVTKFESVTVVTDSSFQPTQTIEQPMPTELTDWVSSVLFNQVGIKVTYTSNLPAGNDMNLTVTSDALGLTAANGVTTTQVLPSGTAVATEADFIAAGWDLVPANYSTIGMNVTLAPQNYDDVTHELTLSNIAPGETLTFSVGIEMVSDWSSVDITPTTAFSGTFPEENPIDLSSIEDYLPEGISFSSIPVYLYLGGLDGLAMRDSLKFNVSLDATYTDSSLVSQTVPVFTPVTDNGLVDAMPTFTTDADGAFTGTVPAPANTIQGDLSGALNSRASDLRLNYNLQASAITITKAELEAASSTKLKADLVLVFPFSMEVAAGGATMTFEGMLGDGTKDLFGRETGDTTSNEDMDKVFDSITSMILAMTINNTTGLSGSAVLTDGAGFSKTITLPAAADGTTSQTLSIDRADVEYIQTHIPFVPQLSFELPGGTMALNPNGGLDVSIIVSTVTDIDQTFQLNGGK